MSGTGETPVSGWMLGHATVGAVAERLRASALPGNCTVRESLRGLPRRERHPLIAVMPHSERGRDLITSTGRTIQQCSTEIVVLTVVRVGNDPGGARAHDRLETLLGAQRGCLSGWIPPGCPSPILWIAGDLQSLDGESAIWADRWRIDWYADHHTEGA